jgi:RNA polymerase sigma-70 factor (ECF subfamily)
MAPFVWRALRHLGVRRADLPDVCQEVFIVVHRRLPDFDTTKSSLSTWIYGICMRTASQYRRRSPHFREVSELDAREEWVGADQHGAMYGEQQVQDAAEGYSRLVDGQVFRENAEDKS